MGAPAPKLPSTAPAARASELRRARTLVHVTTVPMSLLFLRGQPKYFAERGYRVHAISSPGSELELVRSEPVALHTVNMARRITPFADLRAVAAIARILLRVKPDVVHAHTPKGGLLGMLAARLVGVRKRVYHVHGLPFVTRSGWSRRLLRATERISCSLATDVLCVSRSICQVLEDNGICTAARVRVLGGGSINGVDGERFRPATPEAKAASRRRLGVPEDGVVLGFIGRLAADKGFRELASAWATVRSAHPRAHLLVVGPEEPNDPIPREVVDHLRSDPRVLLHGADWDTPPLYAAMDLVVLPSYREGLPVVPLEAAASGLPVVATDIAGCRDAVENGTTGTLVPPRDAGALAQAISTYISDHRLAALHGDQARRWVLEHFSPDRIREELAAVYEAGSDS